MEILKRPESRAARTPVAWQAYRHAGSRVTRPLLRRPRITREALALSAMWLFIAAIASVDVYCSIKYDVELLTEELNPIGRWLMALDGGSVSLFMAIKFFCNLLALAGLQVLYAVHRPLCLAAAGVMTAVQACLAVMLLA